MQPEQVSIEQWGNSVTVNVSGNPGRKVGIFWSPTLYRKDFRFVPETVTSIGQDGKASLDIDASMVGIERFFIGLFTADDSDFWRNLRETEVFEVYFKDMKNLWIAEITESGEYSFSTSTIESYGIGAKGIRGGSTSGPPGYKYALTVIEFDPSTQFDEMPPDKRANSDELFPEEIEHTVVKGETLSHIALKYYGSAVKDSWMKIYEANKDIIGDDPNLIRPGQVLRIPNP